MLDIAIDYGRAAGSVTAGAVNFAQDLMRGDPATFKRGYSAENALLATFDAFEIGRDSTVALEIRDRLADRIAAQD